MLVARSLALLLVFGPPAPTIEPGAREDPSERAVEGPSEGPSEPPSEPGIEFARPLPDPDGDTDSFTADSDTADSEDGELGGEGEETAASDPEPSWPTPGDAPGDGMAAITTGAILIPGAALMSWALYAQTPGRSDRNAIIAVGSVMGALGAGMIGMGFYRRAKLHKWALAYRVRTYPQGGGLLAAGSIALTFGAGLTGAGILALTRDDSYSAALLLGIGGGSLAVVAPLTLVFGKRRRDRYVRTGGWYRPELPPVPTARVVPLLTPTSAGIGIAGQF